VGLLAISILIIIIRKGPSLISTPGLYYHFVTRKKHVVARPAKARAISAQARGNAIRIGYVSATQPKHVGRARLSLSIRPLGFG
jgi:hypothetical protein